MNMDKTLIITSDRKTTTLLFIDNDNIRWKITITDKSNIIQMYKNGDKTDEVSLITEFIGIAEEFGSKWFLHCPQVKWSAAEIRKTCPDWEQYNIVLCLDGDVSISGPSAAAAKAAKATR